MKIRIVVLFISSVILMGCMPQRKYTPEKFEVPEDFRISEIAVNDEKDTFEGDSLVYAIDSTKLAWKNYFQDERLVELINTGLEHNFDVRKALKRMEIYNLQFKQDRKSTRLNSSHVRISYAVFCLKKNNVLLAR